MRLRLIDLDGSLAEQRAFLEAAGDHAQLIDARDRGQALRLWGNRRSIADFQHFVTDLADAPGQGPVLTFLGSGDFHQLTAPLLAGFDKPFSLIHFDNHPDWVRLPPAWHCGSWVNRALELPNIARIVTVGPTSEDLERPQFKGGNLKALTSGRLELYPYAHAPSRVWGRIGDSPSYRREGDHLVWRTVERIPADEFWTDILDRLPTDDVYVTIDKDVLAPEDADTNWDQGQMRLTELVDGLTRILARKRLIGADVVGDHSPARFRNPLKALSAHLDHPKTGSGRDDADRIALNAGANLALWRIFAEAA